MPQMAPLNWVSLYILFSLLFLTSMIFNYYLSLYLPKMSTSSPKTKSINWKW